jgi:hypothetical protein
MLEYFWIYYFIGFLISCFLVLQVITTKKLTYIVAIALVLLLPSVLTICLYFFLASLVIYIYNCSIFSKVLFDFTTLNKKSKDKCNHTKVNKSD